MNVVGMEPVPEAAMPSLSTEELWSLRMCDVLTSSLRFPD